MTYDEVIRAVSEAPGKSFTGFHLRADGCYLGTFAIYTLADDEGEVGAPSSISIHYEGGLLFSSGGEEEFYSVEDAPEVVKTLNYQPTASLPEAAQGGMCAEYILHAILPKLPDPEGLWGGEQHKAFAVQALAEAKTSGFITIG